METTKDRAILIIDGGYLSHECKAFPERKGWEDQIPLDHALFKTWAFEIAGPTTQGVSFYVDGNPVVDPCLVGKDRRDGQERGAKAHGFYRFLEGVGYIVRLGNTYWNTSKCCGTRAMRQKQVDGLVFFEIASQLSNMTGVNHIILVAGDEDHVPAVRFAREHGCRVTLIHGTSDSFVLKNEATDCHYFTRDDLWRLRRVNTKKV